MIHSVDEFDETDPLCEAMALQALANIEMRLRREYPDMDVSMLPTLAMIRTMVRLQGPDRTCRELQEMQAGYARLGADFGLTFQVLRAVARLAGRELLAAN